MLAPSDVVGLAACGETQGGSGQYREAGVGRFL
ncbi:burhizin family lasso peptide precursor [Robbsia andropogonis]|nr:burhizin family lasso peptide precursor [Robbsia andropogonis]